MNPLRKIYRQRALPSSDIWLTVKAAVLLAFVRCALWVFPFYVTRRLLDLMSYSPLRSRVKAVSISPKRVAFTVGIASRAVPGAKHCLTQALVTRLFLIRRGLQAELCFGIDRNSADQFIAHAWVESNGVVVIGGPDIHRYIRLTSHRDSVVSPS